MNFFILLVSDYAASDLFSTIVSFADLVYNINNREKLMMAADMVLCISRIVIGNGEKN